MNTLADALPAEQQRVRELVKQYRDPILDGAGELAARLMEVSLANAERAAAAGDVAKMAAALADLRTWTG